eukprot:CAMPEP_0113844306 /NCGR_PEP_ID=MMETSP0372-20130328/172_1 /TAXON_ID=340204 /ORGANISM="Lankesteria abbotti" /LENGTH=415 /DNA_ID=CAMNT_0000813311 /DNA_START=787 /DNA_END=2034 /DNA_ORIENTATION=- /assembly_acc=CAM_ASM_000359
MAEIKGQLVSQNFTLGEIEDQITSLNSKANFDTLLEDISKVLGRNNINTSGSPLSASLGEDLSSVSLANENDMLTGFPFVEQSSASERNLKVKFLRPQHMSDRSEDEARKPLVGMQVLKLRGGGSTTSDTLPKSRTKLLSRESGSDQSPSGSTPTEQEGLNLLEVTTASVDNLFSHRLIGGGSGDHSTSEVNVSSDDTLNGEEFPTDPEKPNIVNKSIKVVGQFGKKSKMHSAFRREQPEKQRTIFGIAGNDEQHQVDHQTDLQRSASFLLFGADNDEIPSKKSQRDDGIFGKSREKILRTTTDHEADANAKNDDAANNDESWEDDVVELQRMIDSQRRHEQPASSVELQKMIDSQRRHEQPASSSSSESTPGEESDTRSVVDLILDDREQGRRIISLAVPLTVHELTPIFASDD